MTVKELIKGLKSIVKVHPEAGDAHIEAIDNEGNVVHVAYIGYDKKRKRIKLEE